jgi:hypothetical protein
VNSEVVYIVSVTSYKIQEIAQQLFTEEWGQGCSIIDRKGCISGGLARYRNQGVTSEGVYIVSVISYKIKKIVLQLFTKVWGEGCTLTDRKACISDGFKRETSRCDF